MYLQTSKTKTISRVYAPNTYSSEYFIMKFKYFSVLNIRIMYDLNKFNETNFSCEKLPCRLPFYKVGNVERLRTPCDLSSSLSSACALRVCFL